MANSLRILRRKRGIVGEIRQITRAMKLVSAAKLRRVTGARGRVDYYFAQLEGAMRLAAAAVGDRSVHPYLTPRPVERVGLLIVAGDKGLCGAFNSSVVARGVEFARGRRAQVLTMVVGSRTAEMARRAGLRVVREFPALADKLQGQDAVQMAAHLMALYDGGQVDQVSVCYAEFVSRLSYRPAVTTFLPVSLADPDALPGEPDRYLFEPEPEQMLASLMPLFMRARLHSLLLETGASEHSARLMAMSAATENAEEMLEDLTRQINRARQAQVTSELLDVVSGADALTQQA